MGIFDNATSVVIGNKEVQSIIGPNGEVFYQKPVSHSYALSFSSASYQTDSSGDVTVYVTLTDNGVPVSGETVNFSDATSVYTGITNNLGVATCNLNYLVNGTVSASYSNVSASASVVSNYNPPSLSEPITYNVLNNTSSTWWEVYFIPCMFVGDYVDTIQGLYNPPMTQQELYDYWMEENINWEFTTRLVYRDGEFYGLMECEWPCYAVAKDNQGNFLTVNYSTTTGSDITITVSDN